MEATMRVRSHQVRSLFVISIVVLAHAVGGCEDDPVKRRLGGSCGDDSDCAEGVCGGGICLDPSADDDRDGLQNGLEIALGTNPVAGDTDNDGLGDKAELDAALGLLDLDGDGIPDVLESATADGDGDCLPDQYDPDNAVANSDLTGLVPVVCRQVGVCAGAALAVVCPGGPGTARCDYDAVSGYEADEVTCDGRDNDCDGATDEHDADSDDDGVADCEDLDDDGDGADDLDDNCPGVANVDQGDGDRDGRGDACDPPAAAILVALAPGPLGNDPRPTVSGRCELGTTLSVYATSNGGCDQAGPITATCVDPERFVVTVDAIVPTTRFAARATNAAGLESACVPAAFEYTLDTTAPAAPASVTLGRASPSPTPTVQASGDVEPHAAVAFFTRGDCGGEPVGVGTSGADGAFTITLALPGDGAFTLYAAVSDRAGNTSVCTRVNDDAFVVASAAPASPAARAPVFAPASPSSIATVTVAGCAAADAITSVYVGPCAGTAVEVSVGTGACPEGMSAFTASLTMADDAQTIVYARSVSAAGVPSACAWLGSFVHDDTAPAAPAFGGAVPASPSPARTPLLSGTAEPGARVDIHLGSCAGAVRGSGYAGPGGAWTIGVDLVADASSALFARATDAAGNTACAALTTYVVDTIPPLAPTGIIGLAGPPTFPGVSLSGCAEVGHTVVVSTSPACAPIAATTTASGASGSCPAPPARGTFGATITVAPNATTGLYAAAIDLAGNRSACVLLNEVTWDAEAPSPPTITLTRARSWDGPLVFDVSGVVASSDTRSARLYEVPAAFTGGACPGQPIGTGTSDGAGFAASATVGAGAARAIAAQAVDAQGNASACSGARVLVARSTASARRPDPETALTWVLAEGGHVFWHLPDGRLAAYQPIGAESPVPAAFTFEGMFATVAVSQPGDGYEEHTLGSYSLAPGEDVLFELGRLAVPAGPSGGTPPWWLMVTLRAPSGPCEECQYLSKYVVLGCGDTVPFYYGSYDADLYLSPDCLQDFVCHTADPESGVCSEYDFALDLTFVILDWDGQMRWYATPPRQHFDESDVEIWLSFEEGTSWRDDFDEVEVTATNVSGEPRIGHFEIQSLVNGREQRLPTRSMTLAALPAMPAHGVARLLPGLTEGTVAKVVKFLSLGDDGEDGDGLSAVVQSYRRQTGPPPSSLVVALDGLLPFVLPVAMPDYADPDRPYFELYALGERRAAVSYVRLDAYRSSDLGAGDELGWTFIMSGERPFAVQYPEFPASMPWLGFSGYEDDFHVSFANIDFDFTFGWEDTRATFGWRLLTLLGGDSAPDALPDDFGFELSSCCGGGGKR